MPVLVLIATFAIPNWIRERSVAFVEEFIMAFAHVAFLVSIRSRSLLSLNRVSVVSLSSRMLDRFRKDPDSDT